MSYCYYNICDDFLHDILLSDFNFSCAAQSYFGELKHFIAWIKLINIGRKQKPLCSQESLKLRYITGGFGVC